MSLIALVGSLTLVFPRFLVERTLLAFVAFGAGSLIGGALLHMIPAAVDKMGNTTEVYVWLISGFVLFLALEIFLDWHHSHTHSHPCLPLSASHRHNMPACVGGGGECLGSETKVASIDEVAAGDTASETRTIGDAAAATSPPPIEQESQGEDDEESLRRVAVDNNTANQSIEIPTAPLPPQQQNLKQPMTYLILIADALHNFIGGLFVGASFVDSVSLGLSAWLAAAAHEVPQELGDFAILLHGGWSKKAALVWNFLSALTFVVGGLLAYGLSSKMDVSFLVPFAAGNFLYIGASDLIPEIKHYRGVRTNLLCFSSFVLGITILLVIRIVVKGW